MNRFLGIGLLFTCLLTTGQILKPGVWRGQIQYKAIDVPFTFEISYPNGGEVPTVTLINAKERIVLDKAYKDGDSLVIPLTPFDIEIKTAITAMEMNGFYMKYYRDSTYPFQASYGKKRFQKQTIKREPFLPPKMKVTLSPNGKKEGAISLFKKEGINVSGTFLTEVSDYRYFEGILDGDSLMLSSFDGAHAFMILGKYREGQWQGKMIYDSEYEEDWVASVDSDFSLRNPFKIIDLEGKKQQPFLDLVAAGNPKGTLVPSKYAGKVLVIQIFGTWCPNSLDQTKYLVKWAKNKSDEVEIVASSYEANYSQEYGLNRINDYVEANKIPYEVFLGGKLSKVSAAVPYPFMNKIEAFPTLVIIDKKGFARHVVSYFNGPATGQYYQEFDKRFNEIIDALVEE